jgi:hypothetical protein
LHSPIIFAANASLAQMAAEFDVVVMHAPRDLRRRSSVDVFVGSSFAASPAFFDGAAPTGTALEDDFGDGGATPLFTPLYDVAEAEAATQEGGGDASFTFAARRDLHVEQDS